MAGSPGKSAPPIGVHDLGGQEAGAIDMAEHELAHWEWRVDGLIRMLAEKGIMKDLAQLRDGIERLGPDVYERLSYYERWAASAAKMAIDAGVVTQQELDRRIEELRRKADDNG